MSEDDKRNRFEMTVRRLRGDESLLADPSYNLEDRLNLLLALVRRFRTPIDEVLLRVSHIPEAERLDLLGNLAEHLPTDYLRTAYEKEETPEDTLKAELLEMFSHSLVKYRVNQGRLKQAFKEIKWAARRGCVVDNLIDDLIEKFIEFGLVPDFGTVLAHDVAVYHTITRSGKEREITKHDSIPGWLFAESLVGFQNPLSFVLSRKALWIAAKLAEMRVAARRSQRVRVAVVSGCSFSASI